ncbi:LEAF RUST 10 DISEASE-RESISTANCE LOCUS RECEPTOR-LIKE PROTEIN KINASE-like 2.1 [Cornus florida]|uniref:LEAF RUST 10 DISEASE-RESISTANCE LOCUS RECEPTOR-LIKE PROTEIN KINASE-like 2.1 n=1 Tax=Cornus florida TaxID=4283 RepID=UPI00289A1520|nr:LEAF RUST 10 DISEASE-RESISTANCE LOCUS RECEPTOR-LIKE PROTEIN KINASE-like 2.1 [Cornus florida]
MSQLLFIIASSLCFLIISTSNGGKDIDSCPWHMCGDVNISYPFWRVDTTTSSQHCGYRGLGLNCSSSDQLIINLPNNDAYSVININYDNNTLILVNVHATTDPYCPRPRHNLSLDTCTVPLFHSQSDLNVNFYFNCSGYPTDDPPIRCLGFGLNKSSYVFVAGTEPNVNNWYDYCEEKVVTTAMENPMIQNISSVFTSMVVWVMNNGFMLNWGTVKECGACEASHGRCGYDNLTRELLCFCPDGTTQGQYCKKVALVSLKADPDDCNVFAAGVVLGGIGILLLSIILCCTTSKTSSYRSIIFWRKKINYNQNLEAFIKNHGSLFPKRYKYSDVKKMTNNFRDKLGQGGYGCVYKGKLLDSHLVAVKLLDESKGNGEEFINEVASISRTSHVNVVTLLGFCVEDRKRALIYEFMPNGFLEKFIYSEGLLKTNGHLGWEKLYQISIGIARGLKYLHRGCNQRILHFDIKPHNILLDEDFCPKISDFGLAKLCTKKESIISMLEARGTVGYIAPEVCCRNLGGISHKSDVYSYGMMILEMVGGRKNVDDGASHTNKIYFPHWVYKHLKLNEKLGFQDDMTVEENEMAMKMILVGLWCIQTYPLQRPSMSKVMEMLEGGIETLEIPPRPYLYSPSKSAATE